MSYSPKNVKNNYVYRGLLKCTACGRHVGGHPINGYIIYIGRARPEERKTCKPACGSISQRHLNHSIVAGFFELFLRTGPEWTESLFADDSETSKVVVDRASNAQKELTKLTRRRERVLESYFEGEISTQMKKNKLSQINKSQMYLMDTLDQCGQSATKENERELVKRHFQQTLDFLKSVKEFQSALDLMHQGLNILSERTGHSFGKLLDLYKQTLPDDSKGPRAGRSPWAALGMSDKLKQDIVQFLISRGVIGAVYVDFRNKTLAVHHTTADFKELTMPLVSNAQKRSSYRTNIIAVGKPILPHLRSSIINRLIAAAHDIRELHPSRRPLVSPASQGFVLRVALCSKGVGSQTPATSV